MSCQGQADVSLKISTLAGSGSICRESLAVSHIPTQRGQHNFLFNSTRSRTEYLQQGKETKTFLFTLKTICDMATSMNINELLFSRTTANKKLEIVNNLTEKELLSAKKETFVRMIKEAGKSAPKSRNKVLRISLDRQEGNDWNSTLEQIEIYKKEVFVGLYVQYGNTDKSICSFFENFFADGEYRTSVNYSDRYGQQKIAYFYYSPRDKARCIRSILLEYLYTRYSDKLKSWVLTAALRGCFFQSCAKAIQGEKTCAEKFGAWRPPWLLLENLQPKAKTSKKTLQKHYQASCLFILRQHFRTSFLIEKTVSAIRLEETGCTLLPVQETGYHLPLSFRQWCAIHKQAFCYLFHTTATSVPHTRASTFFHIHQTVVFIFFAHCQTNAGADFRKFSYIVLWLPMIRSDRKTRLSTDRIRLHKSTTHRIFPGHFYNQFWAKSNHFPYAKLMRRIPPFRGMGTTFKHRNAIWLKSSFSYWKVYLSTDYLPCFNQ